MGILDDVMKALDRIPVWKRVQALPEEVEKLKVRLEAIEKRLDGTSGQLCPICNKPQFKRVASKPDPVFGAAGVLVDTFRCEACKHEERRQRDTMQSGG